ncbi:MAG TPA: hypothetical protein VL094_08680 [Sphingomonadaceae bacterium]|nr:hypothetical protein [Sphingomonadaceae bacterium]
MIDSLADAERLALAYAPRPATLVLLALEARLAQAIRQASEPIMAQMRLAWWRDQIALAPTLRENSDGLAAALTLFAGEEEALSALVDGWEVLLSEQMDEAAIERIALGRSTAFGALARLNDAGHAQEAAIAAARRYVLADLAAKLTDGEERAAALALAGREGTRRIVLPRALRSLAVLDGLARRSIGRGGTPLLNGPGSAIAAIRLGLAGR